MSRERTTRKPHRSRTVGWSMVACSLLAMAGCSPAEPPESVVLISLDTTRKDHLSLYGYDRDTTPTLEALGAGGAVFDNGVAQMTFTNPSHASMFTGLYPKSHGVGENTRTLDDEFLTLTEILAAVGLRTGGFVSGHPLKSQITGIDQGFETYDSDVRRRRDGAETTDRALDWLAGLEPDEPFFLFVHFYDAHGPFRRKPEYEELFVSESPGRKLGYIPSYQQIEREDGSAVEQLNPYVDRYDRMLRFQDDQVARILDSIDLDRTLVVVVADHGETLGERAEIYNLNHGSAVFEEQIAIPFLFAGPTIEAGRFTQSVATVDLLPTILELMGLELPPGLPIEGESLVPLIEGRPAASARRPVFSSARARKGSPYQLRRKAFIHAVRSGPWKLVVYPGVDRDHFELYDLRSDPGERRDVAAEFPRELEEMKESFEAWRTAEPSTESDEVAPEDLEDLRALGYVG